MTWQSFTIPAYSPSGLCHTLEPLCFRRKQQPWAHTAQCEDNQECSPRSIPHKKQTPLLALHHLRKLRSLSLLAPFHGPQASAEQWKVSLFNYMPLIFSPLKVSFLVIRRGKQGRGQLYFPSLLTWQSICRFVFLTCGFIWESKYITSNIGFGRDRSWRENNTFSQYFVDQKKLNNGCNFSGIRSKWCGKRDRMMTDKINYVQQDQ